MESTFGNAENALGTTLSSVLSSTALRIVLEALSNQRMIVKQGRADNEQKLKAFVAEEDRYNKLISAFEEAQREQAKSG